MGNSTAPYILYIHVVFFKKGVEEFALFNKGSQVEYAYDLIHVCFQLLEERLDIFEMFCLFRYD